MKKAEKQKRDVVHCSLASFLLRLVVGFTERKVEPEVESSIGLDYHIYLWQYQAVMLVWMFHHLNFK